jgi:AraC family transcriptional regulator
VQTRLLVVHSTIDRPKWAAVRPLAPRQLRHAVGLLEDGLTAGTGVDAISRELGMGASRFAKAFRASLGVPPHRYLMERRIERAKRLLATTKQPLASIAVACGFASQSHMTEHVRRFCGTTPARLRSSSANDLQESEF